jgi:ring-1,2-phenylacetyl-CoA epoxidase subunit PaaC
LATEGISDNLNEVKNAWSKLITEVLKDSNITIPVVDFMQTDSRKGIHTEHLGHLLTEMQYLQRSYPDAKW